MAKTTHASPYSMLVADLTHELTLKVDEAERYQEVIARLSVMDQNSRLPYDVVEYIGAYTGIQIVSKEGIVSNVSDMLKTALEALMKAIKWLVEKIGILFKYIFDSQFRARKEFLDLQSRIAVLQTNPSVVTNFAKLNGDVVKKVDVDNIITKTSMMSSFIADLSSHRNLKDVVLLVNEHSADAGIKYSMVEGKPHLDCTMAAAVPARNISFDAAGWTVDGVMDTIGKQLGAIDETLRLRASKDKLDSEVSSLKSMVNKLANTDNINHTELQRVQMEVAVKCQIIHLMAEAIGITIRRSHNVQAFVTSLYNEMHKLA